MTTETTVKVTAAKGRPMLSWVGKRPLGLVTAFPAQAVERFDPQHVLGSEPSQAYAQGGLLFHGDNNEVLAHLLASGFRGKVNLIYIDPPFDSGADYVRKVSLRGGASGSKLDGETYTLGEQTQYTDIWANDNYLQFMYERLLLLRELLADNGSIYLHCDPTRGSYLRLAMDEVFGSDNFVNEIIWRRAFGHSDAGKCGNIHDNILIYGKSNKRIWNTVLHAPNKDYVEMFFDGYDEDKGERYQRISLSADGLSGGGYDYEYKGVRANWRCPLSTLKQHDAEGRLHWPKKGVPRLKRYESEYEGTPLQDIWTDISKLHNQSTELIGFPTQKPEALLDRVLQMSSNQGDLILDCFIGSGTTAAVAQKLGRRWIGCDINKGAIQTTSKRLQSIITEQLAAKADAKKKKPKAVQTKLDVDDTAGTDETAAEVTATPEPAQMAFSIWRVNDYDLQIQHNEAVELACEHLGVTRTKSDSFFDGTRGQVLVKVVPFNHPLSPLDLEEVKRALDARPDETRSVLIICLGVELAAQAWIEEWNRLRKKDDPNRMDYIELRTDSKYGKFFEHHPASAQISIKREGKTGHIQIENFVSPTVLERLTQAAGVLTPTIDDWRCMVDCVLIDSDYDGSVFNIVLSDVPEKKNDFVARNYKVDLPKPSTTVAVKIIDMLGEELLEIRKV